MTRQQLHGYLRAKLLQPFESVEQHYPNPWQAYEAAKQLVKRLCEGRNGFDWRLYDYYQPMIVEWAGVDK